MIKALAAKGGVIQINYEQNYLSDEYRKAYAANAGDVSKADEAFKKECGDDFVCIGKAEQRQLQQLQAEGKLPRVSWEKIIEHIDHVVKLVGPDHVGLGSDFDGADMPDGMEDCSQLPKITEALVRKGYSDADIQKILGGNILRVLDQSQTHQLNAQKFVEPTVSSRTATPPPGRGTCCSLRHLILATNQPKKPRPVIPTNRVVLKISFPHSIG